MRCDASTAPLQGLLAQPQVPTALLSSISTETHCPGRAQECPGLGQGWGGGDSIYPSPAATGKGKEEGSEKAKTRWAQVRSRRDPPHLPRASLARSAAELGRGPGAACQPSAEQEGSCTKKHISLLKAGHLATLTKSALVSGSVLSTLFYFCPSASFSYYKQDFQS